MKYNAMLMERQLLCAGHGSYICRGLVGAVGRCGAVDRAHNLRTHLAILRRKSGCQTSRSGGIVREG